MMELSNIGLKTAMQNIKNLKENMNTMNKEIKLKHNKILREMRSLKLKDTLLKFYLFSLILYMCI